MAAESVPLGAPGADDRVLPFTRGLSLFIAPFLVVAFVILYVFPGQTTRLWAFLYFTAPFLVLLAWLLNHRHEAPPRVDEEHIGPAARWVVGVVPDAPRATPVSMLKPAFRPLSE